MPLFRDFEDKTGLLRHDAFIVVSKVQIDWNSKFAVVELNLHNSLTSWLQGKIPFDSEVVIFSTTPDELGKTFDDFFALSLLADPSFNLPLVLEQHLSMLPVFSGSRLVPFPS